MTDYKLIKFNIKEKQSSINSITYSKDTHYVAIGKNNGLVEIFDSSQHYLSIVKVIVSNENAVDAIEFMTIDGRIKLVGVASSKLFVIDVRNKCISQEHILPNNVCGRSISQCNDMIAVGCDLGYLCFYNLCEQRLVNIIHDMEQTILSLAWSSHFKNFLFVGSVGKFYRVDLISKDVQYFDVGRESSTSETFIWCARFVEKALCTGDSRGFVTVWDADNFGILQRFKTHEIDILSLAAGHNCVYASGTDPTIVIVDLEQNVISTKRYGMPGNVRGMCVFDKSIVAVGSAGDICIYDTILKSETTNTKYIKIDQSHQCEFHDCKISKSTILFHYTNKAIEIYELSHRIPNQHHLFTVYACQKRHIQAWSASEDLMYLAYSTDNETRVLKTDFCLDHSGNITLRIKRLKASDSKVKTSGRLFVGEGDVVPLRPANIIKFAKVKDTVYLIAIESINIGNSTSEEDHKCQICIYEMLEDKNELILRTTVISKDENDFNSIHKLEVSPNGCMIAFSTLDGTVFVYSLETFSVLMKIVREETAGHVSKPRVLTMAFNSTNKRLSVTYTNRQIYDVSIAKQLKSGWCHRFNRNMPTDWLHNGDVRQMIPVTANKFIILVGKHVIAKLDMEKKIPNVTTPLFMLKQRTQELKLQIIKRELNRIHIKVARLNKIKLNLEKIDRSEDVLKMTRKKERMEKRLKDLQAIDLADEEDNCFTWHIEKSNLIALHYIPVGHVLIALSQERVDDERLNYSRRLFGL